MFLKSKIMPNCVHERHLSVLFVHSSMNCSSRFVNDNYSIVLGFSERACRVMSCKNEPRN